MTSKEHDERCIHYEGVYVSDQGDGFPFFAYGNLGPATLGNRPEDVFESTQVDFNCDILTAEAHAYLDEHGDDMAARIIGSFAQLWLAEHRRFAAVATDAPDMTRNGRRPSRRQRRAKAKLWREIEIFLRTEALVHRD